jgi:hypothetical protein
LFLQQKLSILVTFTVVKYLLGLVLIISINTNTQAQTYTPMVSKSKAWCIEWFASLGYGGFSFQYTNDTVLNGTTFNIYTGTQSASDICYLFENIQERKVFKYNPITTATELLYDFNLIDGDTITLHFKDFKSILMTVAKVDTLINSTDTLKVIHFNHDNSAPQDEPKLKNNFKWIEGVGSNWHPNYTDYFTTATRNRNTGYDVICAYENERRFYINDTGYCHIYSENSNCQSINNDKEFLENDILIYPSPFSDYFTVEARDISKVLVYDAKGKQVHNVRTENHNNVVLVFFDRNISPGFYFVKIMTKSTIFTQKLLKQ